MPPVLGWDKLKENLHEAQKFAFGDDTIEYRLLGGGRLSITAIFNRIFEQVDPDTERVVASNQPTLGIKLSDLPRAPRKGDIVKVKNELFRVIDSQEDGEGLAELFLHRVVV